MCVSRWAARVFVDRWSANVLLLLLIFFALSIVNNIHSYVII